MSRTAEIRWHGRGGQGVITAAKILSEAAMIEGKYFQALPDYGAERTGAPIRAYTRISTEPIVPYCQVTQPDVVVVTDPTLLDFVNVTEGLKPGGMLVVNTSLSPDALRSQLAYDKGKVCTVDATTIAVETIGRGMPNTPMLGALIRATDLVGKESMVEEMQQKLGATLKQEVVERNIRAFERAYDEAEVS